jgi:hypothetical protein
MSARGLFHDTGSLEKFVYANQIIDYLGWVDTPTKNGKRAWVEGAHKVMRLL